MTSRIYVLYHAQCSDGFGAAWAFYQKYGEAAHYIPVSYGDPVPEIVSGSDLFIVDFSYPRSELIDLSWRTNLTVLDHHKSAEEALRGLEFCHFDMNHSGAVLAWTFLFPDRPVPDLLLYVQDRDLWSWKLPDSRAVNAFIQLHEFDFHVWNDLSNLSVSSLASLGEVVLDHIQQQVLRIVVNVHPKRVGPYRVPTVNTQNYISEACEQLLELYRSAPFVAAYFTTATGERQWSLRSRGDFDVSEVAVALGGGGHKAAAGFTERKKFYYEPD